MKTAAEICTNARENFRNTMAEYFKIIGDNKTSKEISKLSHEKLIIQAYLFATDYFQERIINYMEKKNETNHNHN